VKVNGVDVFKPQTGEVISDNADGIAGFVKWLGRRVVRARYEGAPVLNGEFEPERLECSGRNGANARNADQARAAIPNEF
jgi:hypothetical protein